MRILFAVAIAAVCVFAGYYLIALDSVVELTITDGSVTGTIQGDLYNTTEDNAIYSYFNATTCAERTDRPISTLTLQIGAITYWGEAVILPRASAVNTILNLTVVGNLDSELDARSLEIFYNQTASPSTATGSVFARQSEVNISCEPSIGFGIWGNGSGALKYELVNRPSGDAVYEFSLNIYIVIETLGEASIADKFIFIRAVVKGNFEPEFSVSVAILVDDTSEFS